MKRKPRRTDVPALKPDLTPMIDVTFLILIFFLLTLQFTDLEGKLESRLPKGVGVNPDAAEPVERARVTIEVLAEGTRLAPEGDAPWSGSGPHRFGPDRRLRYTCGPRACGSLAEVRAYLAAERARDAAVELVVDARDDTIYEDALAVIDLAGAVGIGTVTLAGR